MRIDSPIITGSFSVNGDSLLDLNTLTTTGSNTFIGDQTITGSLAINDSATNFLIEGNSFGQTYLTAGGAIVLNPGYGGVEMVGSNRTFKATDITAEGFVSGEIRANNGVVSGSSQVVGILSSLNSYTGSNDTKWTSIGNLTGSYATTGSNTFYGTQVFSGSVFIATDLIVQGSSSIQYISASSVSIGTNIVNLNTATPSVRYAGISVQDSGSSAGVTGSMLWDSLCNRWIYSNPSTIGYSGGMLLSGPRAATLGSEITLTCNYVAKSGGGDHLYDSCIIDDGTTVCINANLKGSGTITGTTIYGSTAVCSPVGKFTSCIDITSVTTTGTVLRINGDNLTTGTALSIVSNDGSVSHTGNLVEICNAFNAGATAKLMCLYQGDDGDGIYINMARGGVGLTVDGAGGGYSAIFNNGNVGIGCTTPGTSLTIQSTGVTAYLKTTATADSPTYGNFQMYRGTCKVGNGVGFALGLLNSAAVDTEYAYIGTLIESCTFQQECGAIGFYTTTAGSGRCERLRITSAGNVGMGITSPDYKLHISTATKGIGVNEAGVVISSNESLAANIGGTLGFGATSDYGILTIAKVGGYRENATGTSASSYLAFETRSGGNAVTERMRITSCGNVFINNSSGVSLNGLTNFLSVSSTTYNLFDISRFSDNAFGPNFYLVKSRNGSIGGNTIVTSGDNLGNINWLGANGTGFTDAASIKAEVDGSPGASNDMPGRLVFSTTADGAGSVTERMRIASNGDLTVKGSTHTIYTNSSNTISFDINSTRGRFYQALTVDGAITAASTVSESGTTSVPWATWTTVKTLPNYQNAIYLFVGYLNGYINYTTYATILQNDSAAVATNYYSSTLQLQMSGRDIQVYQNSGSTQSIGWKLLKIN